MEGADGHEKRSAEKLQAELKKQNYPQSFIAKCYAAIEKHKYNMAPTTVEGKIIKDADKLAWLGLGRWQSCLQHGQRLDSILELLPRLRNEILYFDESKQIYDEEMVKLVQFLVQHRPLD